MNKKMYNRYLLAGLILTVLLAFSACDQLNTAVDTAKDKLNTIVNGDTEQVDDDSWIDSLAGSISSEIPAIEKTPGKTTFLFFGDAQPLENLFEYRDFESLVRVATMVGDGKDADFVLQSGDIVNTGDSRDEWQAFFEYATPVFKNLPLFTAPGNHETTGFANTPGHKPEVYLRLFNLPDNGPEGYETEYYSIDFGQVHVISLSSNYLDPSESYSDNPEECKQIADRIDKWIKDDLAATKKPWKIVLMHQPAWPVMASKTQADMKERWIPILEKRKVDLILCGNEHMFTRSWPMPMFINNDDTIDLAKAMKGTVQIIGCASHKFYDVNAPMPDFIAASLTASRGWHTITATETRLSVTAYNDKGEAFDSFEKEK